MEKFLFLEYKFGDFQTENLRSANPTGIIASLEELNKNRWEQINSLDVKKAVSVVVLPGDVCPASDSAKEFLKQKIAKAVEYQPDIIFFDHLRFEGNWEADFSDMPNTHKDCKHCSDKKRTRIVRELAEYSNNLINCKSAYFAVPFKNTQFPGVQRSLGQDHSVLASIFNIVSPMLYHRMIDKPVNYISEYTNYLYGLGIRADILPSIQIKDMPDDLPDRLGIDEIQEAVEQAARPPSYGVAVFSWDQAVEKNKLAGVSKILKKL